MNRFLNFLIILFFLYSCSGKDNEKVSVISDGELETQMIEAYKEGMRELEKGDVIYASRKFNEAELLYPQSAWASKSILMAAYAFYSQNYYDRSILELERFISKYPKHKKTIEKFTSIAAKYHKEFEKKQKAQKHHLLDLSKYLTEDVKIKSINKDIVRQLKELNDLYKSGALSGYEFEKAKKKLLNN